MLHIIITKIKKFLEKMAKISNYGKDTSVSGQDKVIGSDANSKFATKNYTIDDIANYAVAQIDQDTSGNSITGRVSWSGEGLVFQSTAITGSLNGTVLNIPQNLNIVLNPADPTNDRFDLFVANIDNTLTVLEGTPSANPVKPSIDQLTQFEIGFVRVSAGQSTPSELSNVTVYNENLGQPTEWNFTTSLPTQIDPNSTLNPQSGEKSIYFNNLPSEGLVTFETASAINASDIQSVTFKIKKNSLSAGVRISFYLGNNADNVGDAALIFDGQFGFDGSNTSAYQNIVIDREDLNLPTVADVSKLGLLVAPGFDGFIDNIKINQSTSIEIPQTPLEWATYTGTRLAGDLDLIIGDYDNLFAGTRMRLKQATGEIYLGLENRENGILYEATNDNKITLGALPGGSVGGIRVEINGAGSAFKIFNEQDDQKGFEYSLLSGFNLKDSIMFSDYGSGTNTGTATYSLNVDANGNVIEGPVGGDLSNYVDLTSNQTISGVKTFENFLVVDNTSDGINPDDFIAMQSLSNQNRLVSTNDNGTTYQYLDFAEATTTETIVIPNSSGTIALTSDIDSYSEWAEYSGTRAGGDLITTLGDYDDSGSGTKIIIDADSEEIYITLPAGGQTIVNSELLIKNNNDLVFSDSTNTYSASLSPSNVTAVRTWTLPDATGTIALTSDLSSLSADQESASFNATIDQVGVMVDVNSATDVVVTVRDFATEAIPVGSILTYRQAGAGKISNAYSVATGDESTTYRVGDVLTLWQKTQDNWVVINPPHAIDSQTTGEPTGSDQVLNVVSLTQAEYDAAVGSHNADTLYVITS